MNRIAVYNLEPQFKNLALEKVKMYYSQRGDTVEEYNAFSDLVNPYDQIYCSSIFTFTDKSHLLIDDRWQCGGTGFDVYKKLPLEIEAMKPKLNFGFCTRGCIRNCKFCVVREKEGNIHAVGDIYDCWDGKSKEITLYDNNVLALPEHFETIYFQIQKERLEVDFNQGLDIRLLNKTIAKMLKNMRHKEYKFAFDNIKLEKTVIKKVDMLKEQGLNRSLFYVLVGFDSTIEEDLYRLDLLRALGQNAYVMRYKKVFDEQPDVIYTKSQIKTYTAMARWANQHHIFQAMTFREFIHRAENKRYLPYVSQQIAI